MRNKRQMIAMMFFLAAAISACAEQDSLQGSNPSQVYSVSSWARNTVKVSCPTGDCPEGVGVLIFVQDTRLGFRVQRCTATAIADDRIIANSHCGKLIAYNRSYFFLPVNGVTKSFMIQNRVYDREEGYDLESGMAEDLAIFTLAEPLKDVIPRKVSRQVPQDMSRIVTFSANEKSVNEDLRFQNFTLDKALCTTVPRQVLFGGGTEDNNVGLSLFGCTIARGNSGAPGFQPGNFDQIQVVVNSNYPFASPATNDVVNRLLTYFAQTPSHLRVNFGMGNRVQCMDIDGLPSPHTTCSRASLNDNVRAEFEAGTARIAREQLNELNLDPNMAWGMRVFPVKVHPGKAASSLPGQGMVLIPYPVCVRSVGPIREWQPKYNIQYLSVGLDQEGKLIGRVQRTSVLRARVVKSVSSGTFEVMLSPDYRMDSSLEMTTDNFVAEPENSEARRMLTPHLPQKIQRCTESDITKIANESLSMTPDI